MNEPGRARLLLWLVPGAVLMLLAGLLAAGPAQAAAAQPRTAAAQRKSADGRGRTVRAQDEVTVPPGGYKPAGCAVTPKHTAGVPLAQCYALLRTNTRHQVLASVGQPPAGALGPAGIQAAYNLDPAGGAGKTIAIVDAFGYPKAEANLATFRRYYGLPPCTTANGCFTKLDQTGGTDYPRTSKDWDLEQALDLDAVSSACPNCHIDLIEATTNSFQNLGPAVDTAAALPGVVAVSNSYGVEGEFSGELAYDHYYDHPGIAVDAAAGDDGGVVNWPSSNDDVMAVGGTTLLQDPYTARGWTETAWDDGGSGCSLYEPQPSYQDGIDTDCPDNKATSDISADANPDTGLAVYDSPEGGWIQVGGTSLSTPLVSAMFGLAAPAVAGTYPVSYPYADPDQSADLNNVTSGQNGVCGTVLCNAGPGWNGPTGLGTPDGVGALESGPRGTISGTITSAGQPLAGVTVTVTNTSTGVITEATTGSTGDYSLNVLAGSYDVTAAKFTYTSGSAGGVQVGSGATVQENFALTGAATATLSGTVTDGSGHKWPMYAKITISGDPDPVYSNPDTGAYSVSLPQLATYTLAVSSASLPGYDTSKATVHVGTALVTRNITLNVDQASCAAPGYGWDYHGDYTDFEGWQGTTPQDGWTNLDNNGSGYVWDFSNQDGYGNLTGTNGQFAETQRPSTPAAVNTSLVSPVVNLSGVTDPQITFDTYDIEGGSTFVDLSLDGGQTWSTVASLGEIPGGPVDIAIPQAAGQADVQVRFLFTFSGTPFPWQIADVLIGSKSCGPTAGGLAAGQVTDANTGSAVDGATIASPAGTAVTADSPGAGDGFYEVFAGTGSQQLTVSDGAYTPATAEVTVAANAVTQQDFSLQAGDLSVRPGSVSAAVAMGASKDDTVALTNTGTEPVQVQLGQEDGGFTTLNAGRLAAAGTPRKLVKGRYAPTYAATRHAGDRAAGAGPAPADEPWGNVADYPIPIENNAVASYDGDVYSVGGYTGGLNGNTTAGYVYDPSAGSWSAIADAPNGLEGSAAQFIDGTLYLAGGLDNNGDTVSSVYAYDPSSNSWSQAASMPEAVVGPASAVVDGQLYIIGGCTTEYCDTTTSAAVYSYDPASGTWTQHASYPAGPVSFGGCAGVDGELVCAGGTYAGGTYTSTWVYNPVSNTWTQGADTPYPVWGADYAGANGQLVVTGGVTDDSTELTNQAAGYDPVTNAWTALPNLNAPFYQGGAACGYYTVGGVGASLNPGTTVQVLPGYDQCGGASWLSESEQQLDVAPGQTVHVPVTLDAAQVSQPGTYTAQLIVDTNTPYVLAPVTVSMRVPRPAGWGELTGTITSAATGTPVGWATVAVCTGYDPKTGTCGGATYTLTTAADGTYQLWLSAKGNPLLVNVSADGYQPAFAIAKITGGHATTVNIALKRA